MSGLKGIKDKLQNDETEDQKEEQENPQSLKELVIEFYRLNSIATQYNKKATILKDQIKSIMQEQNITTFSEDGYTAKRSVQNRAVMVDERLLAKLHNLGLDDCIMQVEKPNEDAIETKIYNHELDAKELEDCMDNKEVVTLSVKYKEVK